MSYLIKLSDSTIFGSEVAEKEEEAIFLGYAIQRPELQKFTDEHHRVSIVRAYKGQGKSGLLRLAKSRLDKLSNAPLTLEVTGSALSPDINSEDNDTWVRAWKQSVLKLIACHIGTQIDAAFSDDAMSLVSEAQQNGYRARSFISAITERLKAPKLMEVPENIQKGVNAGNYESILKRWAARGDVVWLFVDDCDQNYTGSPKHRVKLAAFFTAIRELSQQIPTLRFRVTVRPNTWQEIALHHESLSHLREDLIDLQWTKEQFTTLLAKRVEAYLVRTNQLIGQDISRMEPRRSDQLIALVIEEHLNWAKGNLAARPTVQVLYSKAKGRPRWLIELCKEAAAVASKLGAKRIESQHFEKIDSAYSKRRFDDTVTEYRIQCPQIADLLNAFSGHLERFPTSTLTKTLKNHLANVTVSLVGTNGKPSPMELGAFLYEIGFLTARKNLGTFNDYGLEGYDHFEYADDPYLLSSNATTDKGFEWEVHPVFRSFLQMKNAPTRARQPR